MHNERVLQRQMHAQILHLSCLSNVMSCLSACPVSVLLTCLPNIMSCLFASSVSCPVYLPSQCHVFVCLPSAISCMCTLILSTRLPQCLSLLCLLPRAGRFLRLLRIIRVARMLKNSSGLGALSEYLHLEKAWPIAAQQPNAIVGSAFQVTLPKYQRLPHGNAHKALRFVCSSQEGRS